MDGMEGGVQDAVRGTGRKQKLCRENDINAEID